MRHQRASLTPSLVHMSWNTTSLDSPAGRCYTLADDRAAEFLEVLNLRFPLRYLVTLLILLAASLFAACGGDGEEAGAPAAAPEGSAAEITTAPADAFAELESYRIDVRFTLEGTAGDKSESLALDLEGAFVAPDRSHTVAKGRLGDLELEEESITAGGLGWVKTGENWVGGVPQFELGDLSPGTLLSDLGPAQLRLLKPSEETVNGVKSLRYSIGRGDIEALSSLGAILGEDEALGELPEEFDIDLWLAEDAGWPVRVTMTARGAIDEGQEVSLDFSLDITDVNGPDIQIEPPQGVEGSPLLTPTAPAGP